MHSLIGRQTMFDEQELAARPQDAPHLCERRAGLRNRTQRPGRDDGIDAMFVERNGLGRSFDKVDWHTCRRPLRTIVTTFVRVRALPHRRAIELKVYSESPFPLCREHKSAG